MTTVLQSTPLDEVTFQAFADLVQDLPPAATPTTIIAGVQQAFGNDSIVEAITDTLGNVYALCDDGVTTARYNSVTPFREEIWRAPNTHGDGVTANTIHVVFTNNESVKRVIAVEYDGAFNVQPASIVKATGNPLPANAGTVTPAVNNSVLVALGATAPGTPWTPADGALVVEEEMASGGSKVCYADDTSQGAAAPRSAWFTDPTFANDWIITGLVLNPAGAPSTGTIIQFKRNIIGSRRSF